METFTIDDCPLCRQQHTYAVEVERSIINKVADVETTFDLSPVWLFTCPITGRDFERTVPSRHINVIGVIVDELPRGFPLRSPTVRLEPAGTAQALTPHNKALYEAGKRLLVDSIDIGREFCKFMVGTCAGAVPVYLGTAQVSPSRALCAFVRAGSPTCRSGDSVSGGFDRIRVRVFPNTGSSLT